MKVNSLIFLLLSSILTQAQSHLEKGKWRVVLQLNDSTTLPFNMDVKEKTIDILNAGERITIDEISYSGDSVVLKMPLFDSEFRGIISEDKISGNFLNHARKDNNVVPFAASREAFRFSDLSIPATINMTGRWEVVFAGDDPPLNSSVGEFVQHDQTLTGTFLTPTGDYRYLEGEVRGNEFRLSCFDGSHLFLFYGYQNDSGIINGHYYSGRHWHDTWIGKRNEKAALPDAGSLTFLKPGYDRISFTFPDADSNLVSLSDKKFQNKIVIVQIMGTWCPNCMDETAFLAPYYKSNKHKGIEIIGLDFERVDEFDRVRNNLQRLKKRYDIEYTLLFAGSSDVKVRSKALPMLNSILAFPTTIIMDRNQRVRRVHTGFTGPATGEHYEHWKADFYMLMDSLLAN